MITCSYCSKELDRKVFCSNAHKMAFRRKLGGLKPHTIIATDKDPKDFNVEDILEKHSYFNPVPKPEKNK